MPALEPKQLSETLGLGAAYGDFALLFVVHAELVAALEPRNHFFDAVDVYDKGAMGAPEHVGVETAE